MTNIFSESQRMFFIKLSTDIDENQIKIKTFPFIRVVINWDEVDHAEVINYGFVGGWGVRISSKYGTVYNARGHMGLSLLLKNGKKLVIGTQRPDELKKYVASVFDPNKQ